MGIKAFFVGLLFTIISVSSNAEKLQFAALDYPPHYGENLTNNGPLIEIVRRVYAEQNIAIEVLFIPWGRALDWAQKGEIDGIIGAWYTKERADSFFYSQPIYPNNLMFYQSSKSNIKFNDFSDLARDKRVLGSVRGYVQVKGLEESGIEINYVNNDIQNFKLLSKGRIDLILVDKEYAKFTLAQPKLVQVV